jgi:hypothetical protein
MKIVILNAFEPHSEYDGRSYGNAFGDAAMVRRIIALSSHASLLALGYRACAGPVAPRPQGLHEVRLLADKGDVIAQPLDELKLKMTTEEITTAQNSARPWNASHRR